MVQRPGNERSSTAATSLSTGGNGFALSAGESDDWGTEVVRLRKELESERTMRGVAQREKDVIVQRLQLKIQMLQDRLEANADSGNRFGVTGSQATALEEALEHERSLRLNAEMELDKLRQRGQMHVQGEQFVDSSEFGQTVGTNAGSVHLYRSGSIAVDSGRGGARVGATPARVQTPGAVGVCFRIETVEPDRG